jgi:hypothetical protein
MPNDPLMGRTAALTPWLCILYVYSTNMDTEYFKHAAPSPFFSLSLSSKCRLFHNATFFVSCIIHILPTVCAKIKIQNYGAKGLISIHIRLRIQSTCISHIFTRLLFMPRFMQNPVFSLCKLKKLCNDNMSNLSKLNTFSSNITYMFCGFLKDGVSA